MDIKELQREGLSVRNMARITGHTRKTIQKMLREGPPQPLSRPERGSCLDAFKGYVKKRHEDFDLSAVRLLEEIVPMGYMGSLRTLRRYVQDLESPRKAAALATVRFETPPGQQAQADRADCGHFLDCAGNPHPVHAFLMVLGFSRALFVCFTASMELPVLMECHQAAFEFLGGMPRCILYDNMGQIRLPHSKELHPRFRDFAAHYGFAIKTHRVRRPRTKGKIERMVDYLKDNFLNGRTFADHADMNAQAVRWLNTVANVRVHGTTHERPIDLLAKEELTAFSSVVPYVIIERADRKVDVEGFVAFGRSRYSVDPDFVGRRVLVTAFDGHIVVRAKNLVIAEHDQAVKPGSSIAKPEHLEKMWKVSTALPAAAGVPHWTQVWQDTVAVTDLTVYEAAACAGSIFTEVGA